MVLTVTTIIKEVVRNALDGARPEDGIRCIVRAQTYAHDLEHIQYLVEEARLDFPLLQDREIEIVHYGGKRYARTYGIEFEVPVTTRIPDWYTPVAEVELTL